ncbi:MAG: tripartite tricarboxylate transporter permease, partial [Sphaerochaetaceae bacterium]|nr:tripartite tricarboxylate transporter permease [Sphaerochaetaceae bacterium]
ALGIPGSGTGAVLLGGLMMWGLNPGPLLFTNSPDFAWGLIASLFLANILTLMISWGVIPFLIKILSVPTKVLIPCITAICFVGAYSTSNSLYGVVVMFLSGVFGYVVGKSGYSTAPMLLAFVLAPMLESNLRKAFIISQGSLDIFFIKPISCVLILILFAIVLFPLIKSLLLRLGVVKPKKK